MRNLKNLNTLGGQNPLALTTSLGRTSSNISLPAFTDDSNSLFVFAFQKLSQYVLIALITCAIKFLCNFHIYGWKHRFVDIQLPLEKLRLSPPKSQWQWWVALWLQTPTVSWALETCNGKNQRWLLMCWVSHPKVGLKGDLSSLWHCYLAYCYMQIFLCHTRLNAHLKMKESTLHSRCMPHSPEPRVQSCTLVRVASPEPQRAGVSIADHSS